MERPVFKGELTPVKQLINVLSTNNVDFTVHEHEKVITLSDVESKLPFDKTRLIKTLVFKANNTWILIALRGEDQLDYKILSTLLGVRRSELLKPSEEEISQELGFQVGGIPPVCLRKDVRMIFDSNVLSVEKMYCGIGMSNKTLEVDTQQLVNVFKPQISPITKTR